MYYTYIHPYIHPSIHPYIITIQIQECGCHPGTSSPTPAAKRVQTAAALEGKAAERPVELSEVLGGGDGLRPRTPRDGG